MKYILTFFLFSISCTKHEDITKPPLVCKDCRRAYEDTRITVCHTKTTPAWFDEHDNIFPIIYGNIGTLCNDYLKREEGRIYPLPKYRCETDTLLFFERRNIIKCWKGRWLLLGCRFIPFFSHIFAFFCGAYGDRTHENNFADCCYTI